MLIKKLHKNKKNLNKKRSTVNFYFIFKIQTFQPMNVGIYECMKKDACSLCTREHARLPIICFIDVVTYFHKKCPVFRCLGGVCGSLCKYQTEILKFRKLF